MVFHSLVLAGFSSLYHICSVIFQVCRIREEYNESIDKMGLEIRRLEQASIIIYVLSYGTS